MNKSYEEYLKSARWKKLSEETKRLAGYRCQICNSNKNLNAHHRTYERLGEELQSDLVCLCNECHKLFHGKTSDKKEENTQPVNNKIQSTTEVSTHAVTANEHENLTQARLITIYLKPTGDPDRDRRRIKNIYGILISSLGKDRFQFQVFQEGQGHLIDFPYDFTNIAPNMLNRLEKLMGENAWRIENIAC